MGIWEIGKNGEIRFIKDGNNIASDGLHYLSKKSELVLIHCKHTYTWDYAYIQILRMIFQTLTKIRWQSSYNVMSVLYKEPYECSKRTTYLPFIKTNMAGEKNRYKLIRTNWFGVKRKILEET